MKKMYLLLAVCTLLIMSCMFYLIRNGVSVRPIVQIKPTKIRSIEQISNAVVNRLFSKFSNVDVLYLGLPPSIKSRELLLSLQKNFENKFKKTVQYYAPDTVCKSPCWVIIPGNVALDLQAENMMPWKETFKGKKAISLTVSNYDINKPLLDQCAQQKHVRENCIEQVITNQVHRKLVKKDKAFFMSLYKSRDYFLMLSPSFFK